MNFLNLLIGQGNVQFPYNIGQPVTSYLGKSIWTLHQGTKKDDGSAVSIFCFDVKKNTSKLEVARNGFKRAKTIRHPNFLTFLDGLETDSNIYIVTEPITPLDETIQDIKKYEDSISWGVYQITNGLSFLSGKNLTHGNLNITTVFVTKSGDWKLGGLDLTCDVREANPLIKTHVDLIPVKYRPPEIAKSQWSMVNTAPSFAIDAWMLGCLIYECYSGVMSKSDDVREIESIPKPLQPSYQKCFSSKPEQRLNPQKFLDTSPYFQNIFVETCTFLENITLKDQFEKESFFKKLDQHLDKLPQNICKFKILPHLITAFEIGPINTKILGTLLKISANLSTEEYTTKVVPSVVKWFAMDDRGLRVNLLENLEHYIQHLSPTVVNDQIFPNVVNGFNDKPALKELTIKSMLLFAPKLSEKTMLQLLKYFAALQKDMEPGIRTNTTVCLGRISEYISPDTRKRVLVPAFSTSLRDPFIPSQNAGLSAFMFTQQYYTPEEVATKVIPEISRMLISPEKQIRSTAFQAMSLFIKKLETFASQLPDTTNNSTTTGGNAGGNINYNNAAPGNNEQESTMLGWAYGLTKKYIATATNESPLASPPNINNNSGYGNSNNNSYPSSTSSSSSNTPNNYNSPSTNNSSGYGNSNNNNNNTSKQQSKDKYSSNNSSTSKNNDGWDDNDDDLFNDEDEEPVKTKKPSKTINESYSGKAGGGMKLSSKSSSSKMTSYDDDDNNDTNDTKKSSGDWDAWDDNSNSNSRSQSSTTKKKTQTVVKSKVSPASTDGWEDW